MSFKKSATAADKQYLSVGVSYKDLSTDDAPGTIEAIVSVFNNKDAAGEVVMPGAFTNSLARKLPRFVWGHNWEQPVGKTLEAYELLPGDSRLPISLLSLGGLYVKGQFNLNTTRGKDAYEDLKFGSIDEFSIGYRVLRAHRVTEEGENVELDPFDLMFGFFSRKSTLYLDELDLIEWSPVLAGMNDRTQLIGVKTDAPIVDLIEQANAALTVLMQQVKAYAEARTKVGRTFSAANYAKLEGLADRLDEMGGELRDLLASAAPKSADESEPKRGTGAADKEEPSLVTELPGKGNILLAEFEETRFRLQKILAGVN